MRIDPVPTRIKFDNIGAVGITDSDCKYTDSGQVAKLLSCILNKKKIWPIAIRTRKV